MDTKFMRDQTHDLRELDVLRDIQRLGHEGPAWPRHTFPITIQKCQDTVGISDSVSILNIVLPKLTEIIYPNTLSKNKISDTRIPFGEMGRVLSGGLVPPSVPSRAGSSRVCPMPQPCQHFGSPRSHRASSSSAPLDLHPVECHLRVICTL